MAKSDVGIQDVIHKLFTKAADKLVEIGPDQSVRGEYKAKVVTRYHNTRLRIEVDKWAIRCFFGLIDQSEFRHINNVTLHRTTLEISSWFNPLIEELSTKLKEIEILYRTDAIETTKKEMVHTHVGLGWIPCNLGSTGFMNYDLDFFDPELLMFDPELFRERHAKDIVVEEFEPTEEFFNKQLRNVTKPFGAWRTPSTLDGSV